MDVGRLGVANQAQPADVYAVPRDVRDPADCLFYYTTEVPGHGLMRGEWDLRGNEAAYFGNVAVAGKRVLQIGAADGFLSFHLEREGAEVVGYDVSVDHWWDVVPHAGQDAAEWKQRYKTHETALRQLGNAYWLTHRALASKARMVYGTLYDIPAAIGPVDVAAYCRVLAHVRDPLRALEQGLRLTKDTVIVTELVSNTPWLRGARFRAVRWAARKAQLPTNLHTMREPLMRFVPEYWSGNKFWTWWEFNPEIIRRFLGLLGFERTMLTFHRQRWKGLTLPHFTIVARRAAPMPRSE